MHPLLKNRPFVGLISGRLITNIGDSLYYIAAMWLVYDLTGSALFTGLAGALTLLPQALQFLVGPFVDQWSIRRLLVATQLLNGVFVLIIPLAAFMGRLTVWLVLVVMPILSIFNQFVYPAQNAALPRIVEDDDLVDANAAFSFTHQGVNTAAQAMGGVLVGVIGAISVFTLNAVTFAVAAGLFAIIRIPSVETVAGESVEMVIESYTDRLRTGIAYVRGTVFVPIFIGNIIVNFTLGVTMAVLPAYADGYGGPESYGFFVAAVAGGVLVGALVASPLEQYSLARLMGVGFVASGVFWTIAIVLHWLPGTVALLTIAAIPIGVTNVLLATMTQTVVPKDLLGRITSLHMSVSVAAMPIGSLLGGAAGDAIGADSVIFAAGIGFLALAVYWVVHPDLRSLPSIRKIDPAIFGVTM